MQEAQQEEAKRIGCLVRGYRNARQMTQIELSSQVGIGKAALSGIELGKWFPSETVLARLNEILGSNIQRDFSEKLGVLGRFQGVRGSVGQKIRDLRMQRGWSQTKLAELIESSVGLIAHYETGLCEPSAKRLARLAQIFKVEVSDLLIDQGG